MSPNNPASDSARPCPAQHPDTAESCRFAYGHHGTLHRSAPGREWRQAVSVDFAAPSSPIAVPPGDQGHRSDPHISENGSCRCNCPRCMTGNACICSACNSPFHDHGSRSVAVPPAGPPDDADDPWWVARGEYQKAMDEADRLTSEAAGITAAAKAAWLAFARGYLKERKVDHA